MVEMDVMNTKWFIVIFSPLVFLFGCTQSSPPLKLHWEEEILTISGDQLPGQEMKIWYLEGYCHDNSRTTHWGEHTVIDHETYLISSNEAGTEIRLQCKVADGLIVDHVITPTHDEVDIRITAHNPTNVRKLTGLSLVFVWENLPEPAQTKPKTNMLIWPRALYFSMGSYLACPREIGQLRHATLLAKYGLAPESPEKM